MPRGIDDLTHRLDPELNAAFKTVHNALVSSGAVADDDVKTIYVSYTVGSEMVAAAYPRSREIEIALALPEDHSSPLLRDATHLTWRTLPVSVSIKGLRSAQEVLPLLTEAVQRVASGAHDVHRDNEHFAARRRGRPQ